MARNIYIVIFSSPERTFFYFNMEKTILYIIQICVKHYWTIRSAAVPDEHLSCHDSCIARHGFSCWSHVCRVLPVHTTYTLVRFHYGVKCIHVEQWNELRATISAFNQYRFRIFQSRQIKNLPIKTDSESFNQDRFRLF